MPCKHTVSFLPLKLCAFCRKHPLPFALSLSFCLSDSTVDISISFHCHLVSNQSAGLECSLLTNSEARIESCALLLAMPDNITLSVSIKMLHVWASAHGKWKKMLEYGIYQAWDSIKWNSRGAEKNSHMYQRHTVMLFNSITSSITHTRVIGKKQSKMPDWSVKLRIQRPLCWVCWFSNSSA